MRIVEAHGEGVGVVHEQSMRCLLVWLVVTDSSDWRETDLGKCVLSLSVPDIPSCIVVANSHTNSWVNGEVNGYDGGVLVVPYCGGFGVTAIRNASNFGASSALAIDMARQAKAGWETAVGKNCAGSPPDSEVAQGDRSC